MAEKFMLQGENLGVFFKNKPLSFKKEGKWVFRHLSFSLKQGESLGILGSNGMGKSTLLKTLAGIFAPDEGRVKRAANTTVSLLTLNTGFNRAASGRENIYVSAMMQGATYAEVKAMERNIIAFSELQEDQLENPLSTYSSGMIARLGFSISHHLKPDILLIDEVLGVGDQMFRAKSRAALQERIQSEQTVVLVSHEPATVQALCNRLLWIHEGKIRAEGDVDAVLAEYNAFFSKELSTPTF